MALSVNLDQWADGPAPDADNTGGDQEAWVNGNLNPSKAHYEEGDAIPYRTRIDDLATGVRYGLVIEWDTVDSGAYAIDYLTGYNFSFEGTKHPGEPDVTPTVGVNDLSSGTVTQVAIPTDAQLLDGFGAQFGVTDGLDSGQPSGQQYITIFGSVDAATVTTSPITYNTDGTKASITVFFTYTGGTANNSDSVVVAWGGHIASARDWSDDAGETVQTASDISGSPYHTRVLSISENGVSKSIGNQDRSLSAAAVSASPPTAGPQALAADEDNIAGVGNNDSAPGDDAEGNLTGTLSVTDATSVTFADLHLDPVLDASDAPVTSAGVALIYFWDAAGTKLYASTNTTSLAQAVATAVFSFDVTATSPFNYVFTLLDQVDHPAGIGAEDNTEDPNITLNLTYAAVGAGGTAIGAVTVVIDDDTPTASAAQQTGTVDEDGVPGGIAGGTGDVAGEAVTATGSVAPLFNPGADQPLVFSLDSVTTGLPALTSAGTAVTYSVSGNTLTASADDDGAGGNPARTVFTFALNGTTGAWTFTLVDQLDHPTLDGLAGDNTENDLAINLSSILRATDRDGDAVAAAANALIVTVDDDTSSPLTPTGMTVSNAAGATASAALGAFGRVGADQPGTSVFVGTNGTILQGTFQDGTPAPETLKVGGSDVYLFGFGTSTLVATTDNDATNGLDATKQVFTMTLNPDGSVQANDLYSITMAKAIDSFVDISFGNFTAAPASGNPLTLVVNNIGGSTIDALFSGFIDQSNNTSAQTTVNVSGSGVGVGTGQDFDFDPQTASATDNLTDRIRMQFLADDGDGVLEAGEATTVNRFTFVVNQNNSPGDDGDALIRVYDASGNEVQITGILVNGQTLVGSGGAPVPSNDGGNVTAVVSGLGYELHGLGGGTSGSTADNDTVTIITDGGYQRVDISGIGNDENKDTFDILLQSLAIPTPFDITFAVAANLTDRDGDTTAAVNLGLTLDSPIA